MNNKITDHGLRIIRKLFAFAFGLSARLRLIVLLAGGLPSAFCHSQQVSVPPGEVLLDFTTNPVLVKKYQEIKNSALKINPTILDTVSLPFLDDFSKESIYPDALLWLDSNVFINRDYPIAPPTLGVATFDGVSKTGLPYDTAIVSTLSYPADTLTSKPINLALPVSDSVYLSFYWQAKGRANGHPETNDSLVLQFKNPTDTNKFTAWRNVWARNGYNPTLSDTLFRLVMIPIKDTIFLKKGFQFRFTNYATISGNVDHWHIDYVFLDKNRNKGDSIFSDVAFEYNSRSLLKNYYAMPWEQYQSSEMKTNLSFYIRNNDSLQKNTSIRDTIYNSIGGVECSYGVFSDNILPYKTNGLTTLPVFAAPAISTTPPNYIFPNLTQESSFLLECIINTAPDKDRWNDTLRFTQTFSNYYAYDDGTVEAGYGLNVSGGQVAYKFTLNHPDTLLALQMLFNWIGPNVNQQQFKIRVWNDNGGSPGTMIYEDTLTTPNYQYVYHSDWGNLTNVFTPYILKTKQLLSGTFYVGFIQYTNPGTLLLNLGLDRNTNSDTKMYYNTGSGWNQSVLAGSWMMRPVFGTTKGLLSVSENTSPATIFSLYPNPSSGKFTVELSDNTVVKTSDEILHLSIFNITGQKVHEEQLSSLTSDIDISKLSEGMYFVRIESKSGLLMNQKLILTK